MSRTQVFEIRSDATGRAFYASDDGSTDAPFTYANANGESVGADLMPDEKSALYAFLTGNTVPMRDLLNSLAPKTARNTSGMTDEKRNDVKAWITSRDGKEPGRVTVQMEEAYDVHIIARDAKIAADEAAKVAARQSRQEKRNAASAAK